MPLAVLASDASPEEKLFMLALFHHDWDGEKAWPSQETIAAIMGCSTATVKRTLVKLVERGWLVYQRRPNKTNIYTINIQDMGLDEFRSTLRGKRTAQNELTKSKPGQLKMTPPDSSNRADRTAHLEPLIEPLNKALELNQEKNGASAPAVQAPPSQSTPTPKTKPRKYKPSDHAVLVFCTPWAARWPKLGEYPWTGKDASQWAELTAAVADQEILTAMVSVYLASQSDYVYANKHPLGGLLAKKTLYLGEAVDKLRRAKKMVGVKLAPPPLFDGESDAEPTAEDLADLRKQFGDYRQ